MNTKLSLITLVACAVAGTTFADVSAHRQSSGTKKNSTTTTYVGNTDWGEDSKTLGEKYIADIYTSSGMTFAWNSSKNAFNCGGYYYSFDALFALSGDAQFSNTAQLTFGYSGEKSPWDETHSIRNACMVLFADGSKFTNAGTILTDFENTSGGSTVPDLEIWATDNAEFENSGKIFGKGSDKNSSNSPTEICFEIVDNAKFVNTAKGAIEWCNAEIRGNGTFENAGDADFTKFSMHENATVVNTGEWYLNNANAFKGEDFNGIFQFHFEKYEDSVAGTRQFENRGKLYVKEDVPVCFEIERDDTGALPTNVSAEFVNYEKISEDGYSSGKKSLSFLVAYKNSGSGSSSEKSNFKTLLNSADLHVKNFGTINMPINVSSGVKLTLGEGSRISGDVSLGEEVTVSSYGTVTASKDVLNIVLTGEGGDRPLISGNLTLSNFFDLGVSFADDAVQKTEYSLTLWGGKLIATGGSYGNVASFTATSGTISGFDTKYKWNLNTTTGVLTAAVVATGEDVSAYSQSSGKGTNSTKTTYVGHTDWGADSKTLGEKYIADIYTSSGMTFAWDSSKNAFKCDDNYYSFDALFALSGDAQFSNTAQLTFGYSGEKSQWDETHSIRNACMVLFADDSKFTNTGTILTDFENTSGGSSVPELEIWLTDKAEFENSGKIFGKGSDKNSSNSPTEICFEIVDNAKFVNTAKGAIEWCNAEIRGNGTFENAGDADFTKFSMHENATVVNRGEWYLNNASAFEGEDINKIFQFHFEKYEDSVAGTRQFENRGKLYVKEDVPVCFEIERNKAGDLPTNVSAEFVNYGKIFVDGDVSGEEFLSFSVAYKNSGSGSSSEKSNFETLLNSADLHVKNFGTINMPIKVSSGVKLTLGEGSRISGDVSLGEEVTVSSYGTVTASKDVLNIVLTGKGGDKPLISGNLTLSNFFDLGVSFADDAVQKTKYSLTLWGGKLIATPGEDGNVASFTATSGTISGFDTKYKWNLDTTTGVLTADVVDIGEEISVTDGTASVVLGAKDVATIESSVTEFSGSISGAGQVDTTGDLTFSGDASALTGTLSVNEGTTTLTEKAELGSSAKVDVTGTLAIDGDRTFKNATSGNGTLKVASGTTTFTQNVGTAKLEISESAEAEFVGTNTGFTGTLTGSGELTTTKNFTLSGNASGFTGTTNVESGTLTVASGAKLGTGAFDVAGTLALNGTRTFANATSGDGKIEVSTGTTKFATDIGTKTLSVSQNATATLGSDIGLTHTDANVALAGTLNLNGDRDFATALSGTGKLTTDGNVNFTSDASGFTGKTSVNAGTFTVASGAKLGSGAFDVAGTLALNGDRTFKNATSGNGTISVASGASVAFTKAVGVKKLSIADDAVLCGNVKLTHGADAALELAGTLVLDAAAGEKVSLGGGKVVIKSTAELDLSGTSSAAISQTSAVVYDAASTASALLSGARVTIFESGTVSGADVVSFLSSDTTLSDLAMRYTVVYDASSGLTVHALTNPSALTSTLDKSNLSTSFLNWAIGGLEDDLASLGTGFVSAEDIGGGTDSLANALLAGDAGTARAILDRLSPKSYAAMIAMPVETFHDDVRSISARLEQRRYDATVRRGLSWEFFAQAQMISVDNDTSKSAPTFDFDRYGVLAGADVKLDPTLLVGIALGAGTGEAKIHNGGGKIESDDYRLNVFGGKIFAERFYVNAGAQLGFASYDVKRKTDYGNANASADGWNAGAFAETGAVLTISDEYKLYAMPYFGLAYTHAATDSFKESGSDAAFDADSLAGDSLRARLGCSFSWRFDVAGARWRVGLDVAYSHELLDDEIDIDVKATDDGSKISETAKALPEDVFSIGPSVNVDLTSSSSIYAGYTFNAGTDSATAHNANVGFRMRF